MITQTKQFSSSLKAKSFFITVLSVYFVSTATFLNSAQALEIDFERDTSLPMVYVNLALKAGAVTDPPGKTGLTHFMGEMLLRGTQTKNKSQIDLTLDQMGARLEVETRAEALILRGAVLSSQLQPFLAFMEEIATEPSFPEAEIKKLKSKTASLIREELGHDASLAARRFNKFLFGTHPYGNPIRGKTKEIESFTRVQLLAHYNRLFQDRSILLIGTGDAPLETIRAWGKQLVSKRPNRPVSESEPEIGVVAAPTNPEKTRVLLIDKSERTQTQINLGQIGTLMTDPNYFPLYLGNYVFGGGTFSSTMMVEVRVKRGWSYGASSHFRFGLKPRSWTAHLFPAEKDTVNALSLALQLVADLKKNGVTQEQFDFAKRSLVNSAGFNYNTPKKRVENLLLEKTLNLPIGFMKTYGPEIEKLNLKQVNQALTSFLQPDKLSIAVLCTAKNLEAEIGKATKVSPDQITTVPYTEE